MSTEHLLDDVRDVNLSYLLLIQRLINTDRELAMFRLKIDEEMADLLSTIPLPDLARLARCNQLLCHFSLDSAQELYALINAARDDDMRQVHAAILLAGQDRRKETRRKGERRSGAQQSAATALRARLEQPKTERRKSERRKQARRSTDRPESGDDND